MESLCYAPAVVSSSSPYEELDTTACLRALLCKTTGDWTEHLLLGSPHAIGSAAAIKESLRQPLTPCVGGGSVVQSESVVVAAGNQADGLIRKAFDELRRGLSRVHDLYRGCTHKVHSQTGVPTPQAQTLFPPKAAFFSLLTLVFFCYTVFLSCVGVCGECQ